MPRSARILAIHAHPDDVEFQCAGTLALLRAGGHHVTIATMTPGDCGSAEHDPETIAAIRRAEARASADLIGAEYACLEFRDLAIVDDDESRRRVTEALRRARPDVVLTAPPVDYLCDHEATSLLVRNACFCAPIPNYATRQWEPAVPLARIPHLYYVDPIEGIDRDGLPVGADFHVDVTSVFATKRAMLACHASQRDWLLRQHGIDEYLDSQERWTARRGAEIGVEYAEAFRQYRGHAYPHDNVLLELVGQEVPTVDRDRAADLPQSHKKRKGQHKG
jgi:LmbE family N-acetylglucosaminyl deacetylase